ncbi:GxxExxY protein [Desulfosoma sp.]|uniref:GxxExxY protein n=1 Tax=Desulfosoma sp. TaxID=2603217 RepID=UPI00404B4D32
MKEIPAKIIGATIEVHKTVRPVFLQSADEECLVHEMRLRGLTFEGQVPLPVVYKSVHLDCAGTT